MKKPIDWSQIAALEGALGGEKLSSSGLESALYEAVRDSFAINEVPPAVVHALEDAAAALRVADARIEALGSSVVSAYASAGLTASGVPPTRPELYSAEDVAERSSHRAESRSER